MNVLLEKFKEVSLSVLPITLIVLVLHFTITPIPTDLFWRFIIGVFFIIAGLGIFFWGIDLGINEVGAQMGQFVARQNKEIAVFFLGFLLGFIITVAEPDLLILARQISAAMGGILPAMLIVVVVSIGVGTAIGVGLLRIVHNFPLNKLFLIIYGLIFIMMFIASNDFHGMAFDASASATGALTTPFILVLCLGVAGMRGSTDGEKDSFGLVGLSSAGPIIVVLLLTILMGLDGMEGEAEVFVAEAGILSHYTQALGSTAFESIFAISPVVIAYLFFNHFFLKNDKRRFTRILKGLAYTYIGLVLFLIGVNTGIMDVARVIGQQVAVMDAVNIVAPILGFIVGLVIVLAEPSVYVLSNQVEEVTTGSITKRMILVTLAIGVGMAAALSMVRILVPGLSLWMFLVPGYIIALILSFKVPDIFVGIAFDSGGVASGPMTATFLLALSQGVAEFTPTADLLLDGFGIIAMVAMTPVIANLILGRIYEARRKKGLENG